MREAAAAAALRQRQAPAGVPPAAGGPAAAAPAALGGTAEGGRARHLRRLREESPESEGEGPAVRRPAARDRSPSPQREDSKGGRRRGGFLAGDRYMPEASDPELEG